MNDFSRPRARILVVDDESVNRTLVSKSLSSRFDIIEACRGDEALDMVQENVPDLILLDVHMPGMSGHDVIRELKNNEATADVPVVLLTADGDRETELVGLKEGAYDFIMKPFRADILFHRISRIIDYRFLQKNLENEVARQTANAEERSRRIEQMSLQTVQTLANAIDAKDEYTAGHSTRVSQYSMLVAEALGWNEDRVNYLRYAALVHDIGKISVSDAILSSPNKLSESEYEAVKTHTTIGGEMLKNNTMIKGAEDVALHHHERFDGRGYPTGVAGNSISEEARIVAIADAFDAMRSKRIYRKALSEEKIREELLQGRGGQFDPDILDVFVNLLDSGKFDEIAALDNQTSIENIENTSALLQKVMESFVSQSGADEIDVITGLLERRAGERAIAEAMRDEGGCLAFFDVDNLKKINDIMGHNAGDKALKLFGTTVATHAKECISCRLGGDEFLLYIKGADVEQAKQVVSTILGEYVKAKNEDTEINVASLSAGLVICTPEDNYVDMFNKADKALYHVKQNGKADYYFYQNGGSETNRTNIDIKKLVEGIKNSGSYEGAMNVEFRQFAKLYEYIDNLQHRYDHSFRLALVTLRMPNETHAFLDELEHAMYCMEQSIKLTVRNVDIVTRYSRVQYLILLFEVGDDDIKGIMERIFSNYAKMCTDIKYEPFYTVADAPRLSSENK